MISSHEIAEDSAYRLRMVTNSRHIVRCNGNLVRIRSFKMTVGSFGHSSRGNSRRALVEILMRRLRIFPTNGTVSSRTYNVCMALCTGRIILESKVQPVEIAADARAEVLGRSKWSMVA
jgi:hypothetical protein